MRASGADRPTLATCDNREQAGQLGQRPFAPYIKLV